MLLAFAGTLLLQSCDKFLDIKPENVKVVSTIEDYRDILASYMKFLKTVNGSQIPVLGSYGSNTPVFDVANYFAYRTGELTPSTRVNLYYDATLGEYTKAGIERLTWMETADLCWSSYYSFLGPITLIINGIETAEGDDERLRDYVKGEALVWRAYAYYKLLQWYAPYDKNEYGVPVYLKPYEDIGNAMPARETQTDVYRQIISDCEEVFRIMERTPSTNWNCAYEPDFVHSLLASVYWYKALSAAAETGLPENIDSRLTLPFDSPDSQRLIVRIVSLAILPMPECVCFDKSGGTAEPVRINCPGARLWLASNLTVSHNDGASCHSSITLGTAP